jgi:arylsulfatase A-like enzyme
MSNRVAALCLLAACARPAPALPTPPAGRSVILIVWDGLRPDVIDASVAPNLAHLRDAGVDFTEHHSTYPTFTMMNSASLASGAYSDLTGYYGNVVWQPDASGHDSAGKPVDYLQPVYSEDYAVLDGLKRSRKELLFTDTLFDAAHAAGLPTVAMGKSGAAYMQDTGRGGLFIDEKAVLPLALANELQAAGFALPVTTPLAYAPGELALGQSNGNPSEFKPVQKLQDGVSSDPTDESGSPYKNALEYMVNAYLEYVLPQKHPRLSVLWLRDPDTTQHTYGIGTPNWRDAMRANDQLLGRILAKLDALGIKDTTDVLVVSDHGHSNVSGPQDLFPLRAVRAGAMGEIDANGYSVSGMIRIADLLNRAGFTAFDGLGCTWLPLAMGIRRDGAPVYPMLTDEDGSVCGKAGQHYQVRALKAPAPLPAHSIIVAVNGGSDYLYMPDHDPALVQKTVRFLQSRAEVGAIFVDDRYGAIAGTMPLSAIHARNAANGNPDIILSYDYDENAVVEGTRGTEIAGTLNGFGYRGMHGSFSPRDVHNTLIASGPDFRAGGKDPLPTGNVDVAPTIARILGLPLPHAQGRALFEAMAGGPAPSDFHVASQVLQPAAPATGLAIQLPTDPDGKAIAPNLGTYNFELHTRSVTFRDHTYTYLDFAKVSRH